jgi:hypothetical protein
VSQDDGGYGRDNGHEHNAQNTADQAGHGLAIIVLRNWRCGRVIGDTLTLGDGANGASAQGANPNVIADRFLTVRAGLHRLLPLEQ